jgi:hypothetical protein
VQLLVSISLVLLFCVGCAPTAKVEAYKYLYRLAVAQLDKGRPGKGRSTRPGWLTPVFVNLVTASPSKLVEGHSNSK